MKQDFLLVATALLASSLFAMPTIAAPIYWDGSSNGSWSNVENWSTVIDGGTSPSSSPGSSDVAIFNANSVGSQISSLDSDQSVNGISFNSNVTGSVNIAAGNTLTVGSGGLTVAAASTGVVTLANTVNIGTTASTTASKVSSGELDITGLTTITASSTTRSLSVGASSGTPTLRINGGTLNVGFGAAASAFALSIGDTSTAGAGQSGAVIQENNAVVTTSGGVVLGHNTSTDTGSYTLSSGTLNCVNSDTATGGFVVIGRNGSGVFTQNGGVVNASHAATGVAIASNSGSTGVYNLNNGLLRTNILRSGVPAAATFNFAGGTISAYNTNAAIGSTNSNYNIALTLTGNNGVISSSDKDDIGRSMTVYSTISGGYGLTFAGSGTTTLSGASTFSGGANIQSGIVRVATIAGKSTAQPLGKGDITLSGGELLYNASSSQNIVNVDQNVVLADNTTSVIDLKSAYASASDIYGCINSTGALTGSGNLILNASGSNTSARLIFQGNNSFTGAVTINGGVLQTAHQALGYQLGNNASIVVNGGILRPGMSSDSSSNSFTVDIGALSGSGGTVEGNGSTGTGTTTLSIGGLNTSTAYAGVISDGASGRVVALTKVGSGVLTLSGTNTYTGATAINGGTLQLGDGTSGNDGSIAGASIVNDGALVYNLFGSQTYSGTISGSGSLVKSGSGALTLSNRSTYTGATTIDNGTLSLTYHGTSTGGALSKTSGVTVNNGATLSIGSWNALGGYPSSGTVSASTLIPAVTVNAGGIITITEYNCGLSSLSLQGGTVTAVGSGEPAGYGTWNLYGDVAVGGGGTSTMSATNMTLDNKQGTSGVTFTVDSGSILNVTGTFVATTHSTGLQKLTKAGLGTMILAGENTYSGQTSIGAGILELASSGSILVDINSGTNTAKFTGTGSLNLDGTLKFDLDDVSAGGTWTVVDSTTDLLSRTTYGTTFGVALADGTAFSHVTGTDEWTYANSIGLATFDESLGTLSVTAVPEPASIAMLAAGLLGLIAYAWRKRN